MAVRLHTTQSSPTLNTKYTISFWVKRSKLTYSECFLIDGRVDASNRFKLSFQSADKIECFNSNSGSDTMAFVTNRQFRDPGAWMHIVLAVDTTDSTAADRFKLYINGTRETSFASSTNPSSSDANNVANENGSVFSIGAYYDNSNAFEGCMTHFHFVDGTAYAPTTFGETDSTSGIWKPKTAPSVTYGNNGFFLKFENSGNLDLDSSGNSKSFTTVGTITQNVDTPSNNFATFNSVYKANSNPTYTNGNLTATSSGSGYRVSFSTLNNSTGKWYAEFKRAVGSSDEVFIGVSGEIDVNTSFGVNDRYMGETSKSIGISSGNGSSYIAGSATTYAASYGTNDIIGIALDLTNKKLYASKNGAWSNGSGAWSSSTFDAAVGAIDISSLIPSGEFGYIGCSNTGTSTLNANFGQGYFGTTAVASANADANGHGIMEYPVPSGFYSLNTKNIKEFG